LSAGSSATCLWVSTTTPRCALSMSVLSSLQMGQVLCEVAVMITPRRFCVTRYSLSTLRTTVQDRSWASGPELA